MAASSRQIWRNWSRSSSLPKVPCSTSASRMSALRTGMNWSRSLAVSTRSSRDTLVMEPKEMRFSWTQDASWFLIERFGVGAERFAGLRVDVVHVPAAIKPQLRARRIADIGQVIEHISADRIGRRHVAVAMGDQQSE